ncbi:MULTISPECIES: TniQ family protein [Streptomyces]|uniref:TniQ family protein n=1 Tax=Streptomyces TaxID=1883 RepID=UPI001319D654|nr:MULTISPECIES: TniQ family protein [Streptomyces]MBE8477722.1 TniQ family protein [Streptomyces justiciae]
MVTDRLARSLTPLPEESLPGFVLRLAYRLERSPLRIGELCGLVDQGRLNSLYLRAIPDDVLAVFASVTHLAHEEAERLTLRRFKRVYRPLARVRTNTARIGASASTNWAVNQSSRYCPDCLRGNGSQQESLYGGAWRLQWHLPIVFACLPHRRLLEYLCPDCGLPVNGPTSGRRDLVKNAGMPGQHPAECRNRPGAERSHTVHWRGIPPCPGRLDQRGDGMCARPILQTDDLERLLSLQQRIWRHLNPDPAASSMSGAAESDATYFPDLIAMTHLIKMTWPLGAELLPSSCLVDLVGTHAEPAAALISADRKERRSLSLVGTKAPPSDPDVCGALLLAADTLLGDRQLASLRSRVNPLAREAYRRSPPYAGSVLRKQDISNTLSRAVARRLHGVPTLARHREIRPSHQFRAEDIPAYVPRVWFQRHFAGIVEALPRRDWQTERCLRRAASLRLAELLTGKRWIECAPLLGMPNGSAQSTLLRIGPRLDAAGLWPSFEDAAERVAQDLSGAVFRVNFANRRRLMANWRMRASDWNVMREGLPGLTEHGAHADPRLASICVWSEVTQGEHIYSPTVLELRSLGSTSEARRLGGCAGKFMNVDHDGATLRLRRRLYLYADRLALACDLDREQSIPVDEIVREETESETVPHVRPLVEAYQAELELWRRTVRDGRRGRAARKALRAPSV